MAVNDTQSWYYLTPEGVVYTGDSPPSGSTVLVCPGGTIDDALADRYGIADKLGDAPAVRRDDAGNPVVVRGGRAIAADVLPEDDPRRKAAMEAAEQEDGAKAAKSGEEAAASNADDDDEEDSGDNEPGVKVEEAAARSKAVRLGDPKSGVEDKAVDGPADVKRPRRR